MLLVFLFEVLGRVRAKTKISVAALNTFRDSLH